MASEQGKDPRARPICFIAMPLTTRSAEADLYGDKDHWSHVMDSLFVRAIEHAGFEAVRPVAQGSHLIHGMIIDHLSRADLVLCDLSSHNPNVFFELGVRTSLNLPIALVRDEHTDLPFDTSGINTHAYSSALRGWEIEAEVERLTAHIADSARSCAGENPLWRQFGLSIRAREPDAKESPLEAKVDLLVDSMSDMQKRLGTRGEFGHVQYFIRADDPDPMRAARFADRSRHGGTPPSALFASAVDRYAQSEALDAAITEMGTTRAKVLVGPGWDKTAIDRVFQLAKTYEVAVDLQVEDPRA